MAQCLSQVPLASKLQGGGLAAQRIDSITTPSSAFVGQKVHSARKAAPIYLDKKSCICAAQKKDDKNGKSGEKQSFLSGVAEALDFAAVRSEKDRDLIDEARAQVRGGEKMSREQYGALRRKIGGTYKDFFKDSVDVKGKYIEDGWVDKTCYICKKDTSGEPRQKDSWGRYAHVDCAANKKQGGVLSKLFGK